MIESWLPFLQNFSKIHCGFSGGLDSSVLLHSLAACKDKLPPLQAIHINHGISPHAAAWEAQCAQFCENLALPLSSHSVTIDKKGNIEEKARNARYQVFKSCLQPGEALLLAHHADDQAETLLLQLFRGAGINGLAVMPESMPLASGTLIRPLLAFSRKALENYAQIAGFVWVEDESNTDEKYSRNYLRNSIIPALETKWPGLVANINRTAKHARDALENLEALAATDLEKASTRKDTLSIKVLETLPRARIMNCLRFWLKKNHLRSPSTQMLARIQEEFFHTRQDARPEIPLEHLTLRRYQNTLYLTENAFPQLPEKTPWSEAAKLSSLLGYPIESLAANIAIPEGSQAEIRFRQGGEILFWQGQHKALKKLLQEWKIPPWLRDRIPLLYINNQLTAVLR